MNIEEAKEVIENYFTHYINENPELALAVSIVLTELKKKDKVINEMALEILNYDDQLVINKYKDIENVKKEFEE